MATPGRVEIIYLAGAFPWPTWAEFIGRFEPSFLQSRRSIPFESLSTSALTAGTLRRPLTRHTQSASSPAHVPFPDAPRTGRSRESFADRAPDVRTRAMATRDLRAPLLGGGDDGVASRGDVDATPLDDGLTARRPPRRDARRARDDAAATMDDADGMLDDDTRRWPQPRVPAGASPGLETLDYEPVANEVAADELRQRLEGRSASRRRFYGYTGLTFAKSTITLVVGVVVGVIAFCIDAVVHEMYRAHQRFSLERFARDVGPPAATATAPLAHPDYAYAVAYAGSCLALVLVASALCLFWAPQAAGGGVTLVMAYLNGTHVPDLLGWRSLAAKVIGVVCACGSSLAVGPEGPMVHVGAAVASCLTLAMPLRYLTEVRGEDLARDARGGAEDKRGATNVDRDDDASSTISPDASIAADRLFARGGVFGPGGGFRGPRSDTDDGWSDANDPDSDDDPRRGSRSLGPRVSVSRLRRRRRRSARRAAATSRLMLDLASHATQREFVSAGAAAGLAAAFGAPIGGVLFSLEEASTHWSRKVTWRSFGCAAAASATLALLESRGRAGMLFFGGVRATTPRDYLHQLPFFVVTAALAGAAGVAFNQCQAWLSAIRPAPKRKGWRMFECALVSVATVGLRFLASAKIGKCAPPPAGWVDDDFGVRFLCPPGEVNDVATTLFSSPNRAIQWMLSMGDDDDAWNDSSHGFNPRALGACAGIYLVAMIAAFGTAVPGGVFLPSIFLGACGGGGVGLFLRDTLPDSWDVQPGLYALIGAAATLGGVFRSSISLVVIMVEGTGGISFVFCIIVAVMVSNAVSGWFHRHGVYHRDLGRNAAVAFLSGEPPRRFAALTARHLMASPALCVAPRFPADRARELLATTTHNGFPVVDARGRLLGMVLRSQLSVLLHAEKHAEPGAGARARRALDAYMRVAHLRRAPMPRPILPEGYGAEVGEGGFGGASPQRLSVEALARHVESEQGHLGAEAERRSRIASLFTSVAGDDDDDESAGADASGRRSPPPGLARESGAFGSEFGSSGLGGSGTVGALAAYAEEDDAEEMANAAGGWSRVAPDGQRGLSASPRTAGSPAFAEVDGAGAETGENTLDVGSFMHAAPLAVQAGFSATRVHVMFTSLGLRHLAVTDATNRVVGIITRKDVMRASEDE